MSVDLLFQVLQWIALAGWVPLFVAPGWRYGSGLLSAVLVPALLAASYGALIFSQWGSGSDAGGFGSLAGVRVLFENNYVLLAGWVHYLAFDLFIGAWEARDSRRVGIPHWLLAPCLALTLMFGPLGLLSYLVLRAVKSGTIFISHGD